MDRFNRWSPVVLCVLLSACATDARLMVAEFEKERVTVELTETPFYTQVTDQCGPSALATILGNSGVSVGPDALKSRVYIPSREGSLQIELFAATRGYRRIPYQIDANSSALIGELSLGRPVLVMQNLGASIAPVWHYAVVVGYLAESRQFVLRSGDRKRHLMKVREFVRTWRRSDYWGMVALRPGDLPYTPDPDRYLRSVAALESGGDAESAEAGFLRATERWPHLSFGWLGLGNAYYAQGKLGLATDAYRHLLTLESNHPAGLNNLAQVQAERGCHVDASATLDVAVVAAGSNSDMLAILQNTRAGLGQIGPAKRCP